MKKELTSIALCDHLFTTPIGLAAGCVRNVTDLGKILDSDSCGFIEAGSFTLNGKTGNHGSPYHHEGWYSLNAMGLPNKGIISSQHDLREIHKVCNTNNKVLLGSSAGFTPEEHVKICEYLSSCVDIIVVNLGCPNVWTQTGERKPIQAYDPDFIGETLKQLCQELPDVKVLVKVSWLPIAGTDEISLHQKLQEKFRHKNLDIKMDPTIFPSRTKAVEVIDIIANASNVSGVIVMNTIGGVTVTDREGSPMISFYSNPENPSDKKTSGGLAGNVIHPFAVEQVKLWRSHLTMDKIIIGCGGIQTGEDMSEMLDAGASLCQIQSAYLKSEDASKFAEILAECYG